MRTLYRQYKLPATNMEQKRLLALDIIRQSSVHSKKEDMVSPLAYGSLRKQPPSRQNSWGLRTYLS